MIHFTIGNHHNSSIEMHQHRFENCDVAVKMPNNFGHSEAEELIREIETMKRIGYHEHITTMLGYVRLTLNGIVCSVMELADCDLLRYVRSFDDDKVNCDGNVTIIPIDSFLSICRQISNAMVYYVFYMKK
jgi:serine/threonine protein kinase